MVNFRSAISLLSSAAVALGANGLLAQDYPSKPMRLVTGEVAGGTDFSARLIAQNLLTNLGQLVIVDNRPGAGGIIAAQTVAKAQPDGYTFLLWGSGLWLIPLMQDVPYDPMSDFSPVTLALSAPNILVVNPSLPVQSIKDLIALAKAKPGVLNYGSGSAGAAPHLAAELFKNMAGVDIVRVPYKGGLTAVNAVLVNEVQLIFASSASAAPLVKSGKLKALAVTSAQPSALAPGLPTVAASGLPGYESASRYGIFLPAKTPSPIVKRLNTEIAAILHRKDVKEKFFAVGIDVVASSPEQLAASMKSERTTMGKVIKDAGIRAD